MVFYTERTVLRGTECWRMEKETVLDTTTTPGSLREPGDYISLIAS